MTDLIIAYALSAIAWAACTGLAMHSALVTWRLWEEDGDRERVKHLARLVLAAPIWPLGVLALTACGLRTLIRYAQGKVDDDDRD